tara:strand:+ start:43 stop:378 length:336 start_codon:yes stop_codon:yes gene_type:complete
MSEVKNMAYWKVKNTLPGIDQNSEGNTDLPDGRSGSSPFQYKSPMKDNVKPAHAHTASGSHPKKQTDKQFMESAKRQKSDAISKLTLKAKSQGLSEAAAKEAALAEYTRNI